jgi:hypothetical protein
LLNDTQRSTFPAFQKSPENILFSESRHSLPGEYDHFAAVPFTCNIMALPRRFLASSGTHGYIASFPLADISFL